MAEQFLRIGGTDGEVAKALRTSPFGVLKVEKNARIEVEELYSGSVTSNNNMGARSIEDEGQTETWILVTTDKPDWNLIRTGSPWVSGSGSTERSFYPQRINDGNSWSDTFPARSLVVFPYSSQDESEGWVHPTNILEAKAMADNSKAWINFRNNNDETANVTIKVMKIWR